MVYLTILGLDVYYRPKVLAELLDFSRKYSEIERDMLKEFVVPYSLVQADGKILRMNDAMCQLTGKRRQLSRKYFCRFFAAELSTFSAGFRGT